MRAVQIFIRIGETGEFRYQADDTSSPYVMVFDEADAGKMAYYQLRWVNPRGEAGPWSEVVSAMITK